MSIFSSPRDASDVPHGPIRRYMLPVVSTIMLLIAPSILSRGTKSYHNTPHAQAFPDVLSSYISCSPENNTSDIATIHLLLAGFREREKHQNQTFDLVDQFEEWRTKVHDTLLAQRPGSTITLTHFVGKLQVVQVPWSIPPLEVGRWAGIQLDYVPSSRPYFVARITPNISSSESPTEEIYVDLAGIIPTLEEEKPFAQPVFNVLDYLAKKGSE